MKIRVSALIELSMRSHELVQLEERLEVVDRGLLQLTKTKNAPVEKARASQEKSRETHYSQVNCGRIASA